ALGDESWRSLAALDAAVRMIRSLVRARAIRRGEQASALIEQVLERERNASEGWIPESAWFVQDSASAPGKRLRMRGALLLRVVGRRPSDETAEQTRPEDDLAPLSAELVRALQTEPAHPARELLRFLRADGWLTPWTLLAALLLSAGGVILEAL